MSPGRTSDVVVVGAGIIGCGVAYELARRGARVQVVDRREVGQGATQASAGVLAPYLAAHQHTPLVELGSRSLALYDEFVARVVEDSGSAVQYARTGTLEVATDESSLSKLEAMGRRCESLGVEAEILDASEVHKVETQLGDGVIGGFLVQSHGFVGASDLASALRRAAGAHGVSFVTSTTVSKIVRKGQGLIVETSRDSLGCDNVVLSAGSWSGQVELDGAEVMPVHPVRGQLLYLGWPTTQLARVVWGAECYLVPWGDGSVLAGATIEDVGFDERATVAGVQKLLRAAREIAPAAGESWFKSVRVGLRPGTPDELPIVGPSTRMSGLVYATGHYRNGILLTPLTAGLVADLILTSDTPADPALDAFKPDRFGNA
jgi:glycine oxidase